MNGRGPGCGSTVVVRNGYALGLPRCISSTCRHGFNVLNGTPPARLHIQGKGLAQAQILHEKQTNQRAAARLEMPKIAAIGWRYRFLLLPQTAQAQRLVGIAEAVEWFFPHSSKGQYDLPHKRRRRGAMGARRRLPGNRCRYSSPMTARALRVTSTWRPTVRLSWWPHSNRCCPPILSFVAALPGRRCARRCTHRPVNVAAGRRIIAGVYHIRNVNAYIGRSSAGCDTFVASPAANPTASWDGFAPWIGRFAPRSSWCICSN